MPELAEVEYYRKLWNPGLGEKILEVELHPEKRIFRGCDTKLLRAALVSSRLVESFAHGKQMIFQFSGDRWLGIHLGMSGSLSTKSSTYAAAKHDHLVLRQKKRCLVFNDPRQFGRVRFDEGKPAWWTTLPPSVLSRAFSVSYLHAYLLRHPKSPIKGLLLAQDAFPGIGNWMADEILWQARLHPELAAGGLDESQTKLLWKQIRKVASGAMKTVAQDFSDPPKTWLFRHRWKQKGYCPRCAAKLSRKEVGGRTTCWCAECQPK